MVMKRVSNKDKVVEVVNNKVVGVKESLGSKMVNLEWVCLGCGESNWKIGKLGVDGEVIYTKLNSGCSLCGKVHRF